MEETIIDLIRHGQPRGGRMFRGHTIDDPLSETGWLQMWNAIGSKSPWQQIVSSPLMRCHEFALALGRKIGVDVIVESEFREIGFGDWEGKTPAQLQAESPLEYEAFYRNPVINRPANSEPIETFIHRVIQAYNELIYSYTGKHILIVSHAGVMRAIIAQALHATPQGLYQIKVQNAGITRITHGQFGGVLNFHNC